MPKPAVIVRYAPIRATSSFSVIFPANLNGPRHNSDAADHILAGLSLGGWSEIDDIKATGGLFFLSVPVIMGGGSGTGVVWDGQVFEWYDPTNPPAFFDPTIIWVPEGGTAAVSLNNMAGQLTGGTNFIFSVDSIVTNLFNIRAKPSLPGTFGNGFFGTTFNSGGSNTVTGGGGWVIQSQAANDITQVTVTILDNGAFFTSLEMHIDLNGHTIITSFGTAGEHVIVANAYQFAFFAPGETGGPETFVCAPYVYPAFQSMLGYTAFAKTSIGVFLGGGGTAEINGNVAAVFTNGSYSTGAEQDVLLWGYASNNPLLTSEGKTLSGECRLTLPISAGGETRIVGAIWDSFIESAEYGLGAQIDFDGHNWTPLYSQLGGNGGFNHETSGTLWLVSDVQAQTDPNAGKWVSIGYTPGSPTSCGGAGTNGLTTVNVTDVSYFPNGFHHPGWWDDIIQVKVDAALPVGNCYVKCSAFVHPHQANVLGDGTTIWIYPPTFNECGEVADDAENIETDVENPGTTITQFFPFTGFRIASPPSGTPLVMSAVSDNFVPFTADHGTPLYTWSAVGPLPAGFAVTTIPGVSAEGIGILTGPAARSGFPVTITLQVTDSLGATATGDYPLVTL